MSWCFLVDRSDISAGKVLTEPAASTQDLAEGETLLAIERLSITANNVSYAKVGDALGYWSFFPAPEGWGIVPAWGFAVVKDSRNPAIEPGQRVYGFLPMASHFVARFERHGASIIDRSEHRAFSAPVYNTYSLVGAAAPGDDHRALLQPLLVTSFLIDHHLSEQSAFGASRVIISSASSKTALGLAWLLRQRGDVAVIGLSSPRNARIIADFGCYDGVLPYDRVEDLAADGAKTVYIDFAGDGALTARVHRLLGDLLVSSILVGGTHGKAAASTESIVGVRPQFFFAPGHARSLIAKIGAQAFADRFGAAITGFVAANSWLTIDHLEGSAGMEEAWQTALSGGTTPTRGMIVTI